MSEGRGDGSGRGLPIPSIRFWAELLRPLVKLYRETESSFQSLACEIEADPERAARYAGLLGDQEWWRQYERSELHLIFRAYRDTGLGKALLRFALQHGVRATVTSIFSGALAELDATPAQEGRAISTIYALRYNFLAVTCYGKSMSELIHDATSSERSMLCAITIDPTAINCRPCRQRLQRALVLADRDFKNKLINKLQTAKQPQTPQYPELELCLYILHRGGMLPYFKGENAWRLFGEELADLKLYSASSDKRSLIRLVDRRIERATRNRERMS